jgi:putative Mn2+ efflux pump MntP
MSLLTIILIAIGLSMDSFAVSISNGLTVKNLKAKDFILIASSLAVFQALMPLLGWYLGSNIEQYIKEIDHWIAFGLLSFIGIKMIYESRIEQSNDKKETISFRTIIVQSIATSIDAFAVGISFAVLVSDISIPIIVIGITTFIFSFVGLKIGKFLGNKLGKNVELVGGIILISIGVKILIEHLFF